MQVVNKSQQVVTAGLSPKTAYSRVVNLYLYIPPGLGEDVLQITPSLGNNLWLTEVTLTCFPDTIGGKGQAFIYIKAGSGKEPSVGDVINVWEPVIPNYGAAKQAFQFYGMQQRFAWHMNRRYVGESRRFGCVVENLTNIEAMRFWVSFTISEG